jgi:hypothetical protein
MAGRDAASGAFWRARAIFNILKRSARAALKNKDAPCWS